MSEFPYWSNHSKKVSIWSVLIYSVSKRFKSDPINNKLLKTLPGFKKIKYPVLMSYEFLSKKIGDNSILIV